MTSYRIECPEIDSALACFSGYSIVEVEGPPTTHADEWIQCSGHPGYPGPCPDGMDWGDWLAKNNVD